MSYFCFNDTATTEIYTLSLHDALPICCFIADPGVVDELLPPARISGSPIMPRICIWHALNQRAIARRFATQIGKRRSEEHTSELQSRQYLVCRLLLEKNKHVYNLAELV